MIASVRILLSIVAASALFGCVLWIEAPGSRARGDAKSAPFVRERGRYRLPGPRARDAELGPRVVRPDQAAAPFFALAFHYNTVVYADPEQSAKRFGIVRRGTSLAGVKPVSGAGCEHGWYKLAEGGFVCDRQGVAISDARQSFWIRQPEPDLNRPLFYDYGRVIRPGALRFTRIPTEREEAALPRTQPPNLVQGALDGDVFLALDRLESAGKRRYYRTVRGRYVRARDVEPRPAPDMHGVVLRGDARLPWAFLDSEGEAPLYRERRGRFEKVGSAAAHGRFPLRTVRSRRGARYAVGPGEFAVPLARVRVARAHARPTQIGAQEKWIHVDLTQQVLVAYEGDHAVFATLISSGKEDALHATPTGLFHIRDKHLSVTMSGDDSLDGLYEVGEVPWTQYYSRGYALHGAYWHDTFGKPRSHGCTNLAPADARWLFYWTEPPLPDGLHARQRVRGTAVYLTREAEAQQEPHGAG
ncbi:MAG TPA: L,D-transpeptidase [Polyangiales bacterium]|nr:L,D-transpeptidase [Polyangiales bacterium]